MYLSCQVICLSELDEKEILVGLSSHLCILICDFSHVIVVVASLFDIIQIQQCFIKQIVGYPVIYAWQKRNATCSFRELIT